MEGRGTPRKAYEVEEKPADGALHLTGQSREKAEAVPRFVLALGEELTAKWHIRQTWNLRLNIAWLLLRAVGMSCALASLLLAVSITGDTR